MTFYGKLTSALAAAAIIGTSAAYVTSQSVSVLAEAEEMLTDTAKYYVIKEYDGKIALFEDGNDEPLAVYSTPLSQINQADAFLLNDGIRLKGMSDVARLLEDLDIE
jgi:hypothetical protein